MGQTAGIHTRSREVAVRYGQEMPASRITVNTPTTHGAIGLSTALPPSMTLGLRIVGGNVTSDNVSPLHLMDIQRVAFETRPSRANGRQSRRNPVAMPPAASGRTTTPAASVARGAGTPKVSRQEIAAIVDRFLANRPESVPPPEPAPGSMVQVGKGGNGNAVREPSPIGARQFAVAG